MGNPRKPTHLHAIAGTVQPCRTPAGPVVELPVVDEVPKPPSWLPNAHAVKEWKRLAPILVANKLLTDAGLSPFGMMCALHGKILQLYAAGEAPPAAMIGQLRNLTNDFGLTPVAQGKVKTVPSQKPEGNAFARNGKQQRAS